MTNRLSTDQSTVDAGMIVGTVVIYIYFHLPFPILDIFLILFDFTPNIECQAFRGTLLVTDMMSAHTCISESNQKAHTSTVSKGHRYQY